MLQSWVFLVIGKMMFINNKVYRFFVLLMACGISMVACDKAVSTSSPSSKADFTGCFSIEKNVPAQIKITPNADAWAMQMKEADGSWDKPEALILTDNDTAWQAYKVNAIGLNKSDIATSIVRHDGILLISQLTSAAALNPALDSPYVVNLFGATNTIYKVACDSEPLDLTPDDAALASIHGKGVAQ